MDIRLIHVIVVIVWICRLDLYIVRLDEAMVVVRLLLMSREKYHLVGRVVVNESCSMQYWKKMMIWMESF